jgi:iron complex transport system permease protein
MPTKRLASPYAGIIPALAVSLAVVALLSLRLGAVTVHFSEMASALIHRWNAPDSLGLTERIFLEIRMPRALACILVGASLGVGGVLMQALFRNPIVEPGLVGTSAGAAFGAALYFVLGAILKFHAGEWTLPIAACLGGAAATAGVFLLSESAAVNRETTTGLLLVGIAVNALFLSGVGFLSYIERDPQSRSITFWSLGTLSGANWRSVILVAGAMTVGVAIALRHARSLNALMMGEDEALYLGVNVRRLKLTIMGVNVMIIAVATSITGVISFVGLVVPHLLRLMKGSDNRFLLIGAMFLGATLLTAADIVARVALRPAELPIGIVTSAVGAPVFIGLLRRHAAR